MQNVFARFVKDESGATAIEYGLIAGLLSVIIITTLTTMGDDLKAIYEAIEAGLAGAIR
jgi:pilus assembly protein Flp/PilA